MKPTLEADASMKGVPLEERETTINGTEADDTLQIWSCRRRHITAMRKHPAFTEVESGIIPGTTTEYARFTIANPDWNPATGGRRRREMTDGQREALSERARRNFQKEGMSK